MSRFFPRIMWADVDAEASRVPVAIYDTKAEQKANRPDLIPLPVAVISLAGKNEHELQHDLREVFTKYLRRVNRKGGRK